MPLGTQFMNRRFLWTVPLLIAVLVAAVGVWTRHEVSRAMEAELCGQLGTVLDANVTALEIWMKNQKRLAEVIANDPAIREQSLAVLMQSGTTTNRELLASLAAHITLQRTLDERLRATSYMVAHVVTTNLIIVGTSGRGRMRLGNALDEDQVARFEELFATGEPVVSTPFKLSQVRTPPPGWTNRMRLGARGPERAEERRGPGFPGRKGAGPQSGLPGRFGPGSRPDISLMHVAAPLRDANGAFIGALAFVLRPEEEFTKVLSVARPGQSGETYAFDPSGRMISQSRFDEQLKELGLLTNSPGATSALTLELRDPGGDLTTGFVPKGALAEQPLIRMVAEALAEEAGVDVNPFRDYRGVPVVGAWRWLPEQHFGVATQIDAAEAFRPLHVLRMIFLSLILLLALCAVVIFLVSYRSLVWRRRLDEARLKATRLGQYTLLEKIGEGGMGVVYRANHALLRRDTAVKLLLPERADEQSIRQFEHEVRLTCQLTHPNTIQIYDYGHTSEGVFYYAMELLSGLTLEELVERHGPQPDARVIHLLLQVCASLQEAHAAGLIHRDIKPGNIFLCTRGGVPDTVKVLDFGLVKRFGAHGVAGGENAAEPFSGARVGTPLYMAPETIREPALTDARSDIYALGAVGCFVLTGEHVFAGEGVMTVYQRHLSEMPSPPSARGLGATNSDLEQVLMRCLEKEPDARFQTVTELAAALRVCKQAMAWTPEQRAAWWAANLSIAAPAGKQEAALPAGSEDVTVRIDLNRRKG